MSMRVGGGGGGPWPARPPPPRSAPEKVRVLANFKKECNLLSKLRHPNIVQFIGVYYGNGGKDEIALVMEKVEYELAKFLHEKSPINLSTKLSILRDVTYGLVYLMVGSRGGGLWGL